MAIATPARWPRFHFTGGMTVARTADGNAMPALTLRPETVIIDSFERRPGVK